MIGNIMTALVVLLFLFFVCVAISDVVRERRRR